MNDMISPDKALPGRNSPICIPEKHFITKNPITPPFPEHLEQALFAMGCFWGAEKKFWELPGIYCTAVGYTAGYTPNPTYKEVCTGLTGHAEAVFVVFNPKIISYPDLLSLFWQGHNPTQGMRQGPDIGSQYRSGIYTFSEDQYQQAVNSKSALQKYLTTQRLGAITTEIKMADIFYYAENYHQQYLAKNQHGTCL